MENSTKFYAGIGSRTITKEEQTYIHKLAQLLNDDDYTVVSGNASGADIAFQQVARHLAILPWKGFNYKEYEPVRSFVLKDYDTNAYASVEKFHPNNQ